MKTAIICDLDGTLCLFDRETQNPYDRDFLSDRANPAVEQILMWMRVANLEAWDTSLILVSGRNDKFKEVTKEWLTRNNVHYEALFMRKDGDTRKDVIVKEEIYNMYIDGKYDILFVFDDRDQIVKFWRSKGLTCFQVASGDF